MTKRPRRNHGAVPKTKIILEAIIRGSGISGIIRMVLGASEPDCRVQKAPGIFNEGNSSGKEPNVKKLYSKIGQLAMENDFLAIALGRIGDSGVTRC